MDLNGLISRLRGLDADSVTRLALQTFTEYSDDEMEQSILILDQDLVTEVIEAIEFYLSGGVPVSQAKKAEPVMSKMLNRANEMLDVPHGDDECEASNMDDGTRYMVGYEPGVYTHGPYESLDKAKGIIGDKEVFIFSQTPDDGETHRLYEWSYSRGRWICC